MSSVIANAEKAADKFGDRIDEVAKQVPGNEDKITKAEKEVDSLLSALSKKLIAFKDSIFATTSKGYTVTKDSVSKDPFFYTNLLAGLTASLYVGLNPDITLNRLKYNERYQYITAGVLTTFIIADSLFYKYVKDKKKII